LREWGSGEARIVSARLLDPEGDERRQFASGEPLAIHLTIASDERVPAPFVSVELRDEGGVVLGGVMQSTADLGWDGRAGRRELRFDLDRLPLAEGRFRLSCALVDVEGGSLLHSLDDAARFFVFSTGSETGSVLLSGRWSLEEIDASEPIGRR
jgi:Wzt C-terminal domain